MIQWEDKYSTGIKEIDHQHQWLFSFSNDLEEQLKDKNQNEDVEHILNSLSEYAQKHFHYEEGCMKQCQCPLADKNKDAHAQFLFAYKNFMERYCREGHSQDLAWKIHDMVEKWIVNHICQIDMSMRSCEIKK